MERKTKYRILGILVIIALVIILLPLFHNKNDLPLQTATIAAPPFPDQQPQEPQTIATSAKEIPALPSAVQEAKKENKDNKLETDDIISAIHPSVIHTLENESIDDKPIATKHIQQTQQTTDHHFVPHHPNDNGLIDLKNAAWVIQIGSYKNKSNALRMVNQLRANGYRAFIQKISTAMGDSTRVFVGPESKRIAAHNLAMRIESDLHIHGIVISYKPLAL